MAPALEIREQWARIHPLLSSSPGCGPYLEGEFKFDQEREADGLQDALLIQSVLDLFQLHHLRGGEERQERGNQEMGQRTISSVRTVQITAVWPRSHRSKQTVWVGPGAPQTRDQSWEREPGAYRCPSGAPGKLWKEVGGGGETREGS